MEDYKYLPASDGTGEAVLAHIETERIIGSMTLDVDNVNRWPDIFIVTTGTPLAGTGYIDPSTMTIMKAHKEGADIIIDFFVDGYVDNGNTTDQIAVIKQTTEGQNIVAEGLVNEEDKRQKLTDEALADFVVSGTGILAQTTGLITSFSDITYYIAGVRYTKTAIPNKTHTASKDIWISVNNLGVITYAEVALGAVQPALPADSVWVAKVITGASAVTSVELRGRGSVGMSQLRPLPKFSAYANAAQSFSAGVSTKVLFQTEEYDTDNVFASSRLTATATTAGTWHFDAAVTISQNDTGRSFIMIYKNGAEYKRGSGQAAGASTVVTVNLSCDVPLASTDYVEVVFYSSGGQTTTANSAWIWFNGRLLP